MADDTDQPKLKRKGRGDATRLKPFQWRPGQSGNPGGKPHHDLAAEIARAVFESDPEAIGKAMRKALAKGSARVFEALADRGFGKLKETVEVSANVSLAERIQKARASKESD